MSDVLALIVAHANTWAATALLCIGLWVIMVRGNLFKKVVGLNILQAGVFLFYISLSYVRGGTVPIVVPGDDVLYSNPLPHVLILTAIVVGVATSALALALIVRIQESYGTIEEDDVAAADDP
jgi:multicomponent Na+:H+ antiporter subunit C